MLAHLRTLSWLVLVIALIVLGVFVARRTSVVAPLLRFLALRPTEAISPVDAINHIGKWTQVCGLVSSAHFAADSMGSPTFLNFGSPYPNQVFTVVIWSEARSRFASPPETLEGKQVCVTGTIETYADMAEIIRHRPTQIVLRDAP